MSFSARGHELLLQTVVDYAMYLLDREGRVIGWNLGAQRVKGYAASEILGQHFSCFYTPEDVAKGVPVRALETARREGRYEAEGWRCRKDGSRFWASAVLAAVHDVNGELIGFAKMTRDLTERRDAQIQIEEAREQLLQAQKMEVVGQLTSGLAHDFNNLLTGIMGSLMLLERRLQQGRFDDLKRYVDTAQRAASRGAALTQQLLTIARQRAIEPRPTDANALIAELEDLIRHTVKAGIRFETIKQSDIWPVLCDPAQLENAILNLCINASDAMPDGGSMMIETSNIRLDEPDVCEIGIQPGEYVSISVTDTGSGMTPEVAAQAFNPLFTTKPQGKGTGLGLAMVYGFARSADGHASLQTELGRGTTIRIVLPRFQPESGAEKAA